MGGKIHTGRKVVAVFDFDGTIITKDSLPMFIGFSVKWPELIKGTLKTLPALLLYALKLIPNYKAKETLFSAYFNGIPLAVFDDLCQQFIQELHRQVRQEALDKIQWHQQMEHEVIIISASPENWIKPWAGQLGITTVLATQLESVNDHLTGKFASKNCHGPEKVNRLLTYLPDRTSYELYAYGDSNGDKELLETADHKYYRRFN